MKLIAYITGSVGCIVLGLLIVLTMRGRSIRQTELEYVVPDAAEQTVAELCCLGEGITYTKEEFISAFTERVKERLGENSEVEINVMAADAEKGILSVQVIEKYCHPNGERGTVSCSRTVILDKILVEEKSYRIKFYLSEEELMNGTGCYKQYVIGNEQPSYPRPENPDKGNLQMTDSVFKGKKFLGWRKPDGTPADFSEQPWQDQNFYAAWEE